MINDIDIDNKNEIIKDTTNNNNNNSFDEPTSQIELPTTFTKYISNTDATSLMLNCEFEMNETKLVGIDTTNTYQVNSVCIENAVADDTLTDNNLTPSTYEINCNKFKNKLTHPLSSSILKTTKSILDSSENNATNFNTYGTSSNDSIDNNSTTTNTLNNNVLVNNSENQASNSNDENNTNSESKTIISSTKKKSILKRKNNQEISNSLNSTNGGVSYFKMFESFLCEKKASFKSGLNNGIRSIQNNSDINSNKKNKLKSFTTPPLRVIQPGTATVNDPKTPILANLITVSSLIAETNLNNSEILHVNTEQENVNKKPKISPIYSLRSSSIHSSMSSSIISPTSSFLMATEPNKKNNKNIMYNNNPFEEDQDDLENVVTINHENENLSSQIDTNHGEEEEEEDEEVGVEDEEEGGHVNDEEDHDQTQITKSNEHDFTFSINNTNIINTPITNNQNNDITITTHYLSSENKNYNNTCMTANTTTNSNLKSSNKNINNYKYKPRGESIISNSFYLVEIRSVFLKVGDIDTLNEKFYAEAFLEATWIDLNLNPNEKYNNEVHWNPRLYILNCLGELKQQIWYNQYSLSDYENLNHSSLSTNNNEHQDDIRSICQNVINESNNIKNGCVIVERRRITGTFWQTLDLKNFPADVQQLTVTVCSPKQVNELQLVHCKDRPSSVNNKCFVDSQEWRLYEHITVREFTRDSVFSNETFSALDLTIHAARRPTFYYWNAFFLIFLITLSSLSIFSIRCHLNQSRIQTTCTLLLTSVTFKWVTNRSLPFVSYMTSLDKYSLGCLLLLCAQCLWHALVSSIMDMDDKCVEPFAYYDHVAFIMFCTIFIIIHLVFIFWLIKNPYKTRRQLNKQEMDYTSQIMGKRSTRLKSMLYGI